jgi:hypothetical protein
LPNLGDEDLYCLLGQLHRIGPNLNGLRLRYDSCGRARGKFAESSACVTSTSSNNNSGTMIRVRAQGYRFTSNTSWKRFQFARANSYRRSGVAKRAARRRAVRSAFRSISRMFRVVFKGHIQVQWIGDAI